MTASIPRDRTHTAFHLRECIEELERVVRELETNPRYEPVAFQCQIEHAYHHLNYAWNSRRLGSTRAWAVAPRDFRRFRQMPEDLDLGER